MAEQQDVIADLTAAGVLTGIRWAYESATRRSLESYCEADGHDPAWLGHTRFTLFRDRLDRVFDPERTGDPAICTAAALARRLGGFARVESAEGIGTAVHLFFRRSPAAVDDAADDDELGNMHQRQGLAAGDNESAECGAENNDKSDE